MNIVLGVGGGIAAYKSAELARLLMQQGHSVRVIMTASAQEFVRPLTFAALTGHKVVTGLFATADPEGTLSSAIEHIGVAQENDLLVVAPATADLLAKFAHGLADDFLTTTYLAFTGSRGPGAGDEQQDVAASRHPANLETLRRRGHRIVDPARAIWLAAWSARGVWPSRSRSRGSGTPKSDARHDLDGETVLITAGPTQEPLDPVRYISNRSSGKMGYALAEAAVARGAQRDPDFRSGATRSSARRARSFRSIPRAKCAMRYSRIWRPPASSSKRRRSPIFICRRCPRTR